MSKCNRIISTAFGLIALSASWTALGQDAKPKHGTGQSEQQDKNACVSNMVGSSFTLNCARQETTGDKHEERRNEREERDLIAQESVAISTSQILKMTWVQIVVSVISIIITVFGIYYVRQTLIVTADAVKEASIANKITAGLDRPILTIEIVDDGGPLYGTPSFTRPKYRCRNHGRAAARLVGHVACLAIRPWASGAHEFAPNDRDVGSNIQGIVIAAGEQSELFEVGQLAADPEM